ncbi:MAG TPA: hypothetical protein VNW89_08440, partial [Stellaceae bacterium]|nr:hypothetical protein [Stellaceae bacterium]
MQRIAAGKTAAPGEYQVTRRLGRREAAINRQLTGAERRTRRQLRHQRDADAGHDHLAGGERTLPEVARGPGAGAQRAADLYKSLFKLGAMPYDMVERSMTAFGEDVVPRIRPVLDRDATANFAATTPALHF